ncbi:hypothetical protein [Leptospira interrogans]|nr:hypothetical protein [Leptospira interrogans]
MFIFLKKIVTLVSKMWELPQITIYEQMQELILLENSSLHRTHIK